MSNDQLLPCPLCRSADAPRVVPDGVFSFAVLCDYREDGCGAMGGRRSTEHLAVGAWCDRAPDASDLEKLAAIGSDSFDIYSDEDGFEWRHFSWGTTHGEGNSAESLSEYLKTITSEVAA